MKKLSKNKFAKLFATFLGASTILTPIATLVSCEQITKTPNIQQQKPNNNNNQSENNGGGTGSGENNGGGTEIKPTDPFTDSQNNTITITNNETINGYTLTGAIFIDDINKEKFQKKLDSFGGKPLDTSGLNINCFVKQEGAKTQSIITTREVSPVTPPTYLSTEITPSILQAVLKLKENRKFSTLTLNNQTSNGPIDIKFKSGKDNYFDITDLAKFSFSENFKLTDDSIVFLRAERELDMPGTEDNTEYAKTTELLSLINNPKIKHKITVGKVQLRGNVKDLLPHLVTGPNKIKEEDGGIIFGEAYETPCTGENWTGYNGIINDNGNINNTGRSILPANEFLELKARTKNRRSYIRNAIITNLDSKILSPEQLENTQFDHDILSNINFKNCDLSKVKMSFVTGNGNFEYENSILPYSMQKSSIGRLTLKNVTFPKEEFYKIGTFEDLPYGAPSIGTLTIYGEIKNSPLKDLTEAQIEILKNDPRIPHEMPSVYKGSKEIYDRLKYIYRGESHTKEFENLQGSIQKRQSQLLALLQTQNKSRG